MYLQIFSKRSRSWAFVATPACNENPEFFATSPLVAEWSVSVKEDDFKKKVEGQGYQIKKFKQPGTCYEIYGLNKEGKKVEIYFNPVDGSIVKEK